VEYDEIRMMQYKIWVEACVPGKLSVCISASIRRSQLTMSDQLSLDPLDAPNSVEGGGLGFNWLRQSQEKAF
jgi:hypothetical protein